MKTGMNIKGTLKIILDREDGSSLEVVNKSLVMKPSLVKIAALISGVAQPANMITHLALGDGNTAPIEADITLENELRRDPVTILVDPAPNDNKVNFTVSHALGAVTGTFKEAGMFDADTAGTMFNRITFADFVVTVSDTLTVVWIVEVRNA